MSARIKSLIPQRKSPVPGWFACGIALLSLGTLDLQAQAKNPPAMQVIGYIFAHNRAIQADEVPAARLTRIQYAFLATANGQLAELSANDKANLAILLRLKRLNPGLQVVASVGGGTHSGDFSDIALTPESRNRFVESCLRVVESEQLDGIDIDWEFPASYRADGRYRAADKENYTRLLRDLRGAFDTASATLKRPLITSTATNGKSFFLRNTEMGEVAKYVDSVELMGYDFYGSNDTTTGNESALWSDPDDTRKVSDDASVQAYIAAGVPAEKIVLGVPFYGKGWRGVGALHHGLFQPVKTGNSFDVQYGEIASEYLAAGSGYTRYWDADAAVPTLYNPAKETFLSYEDTESLAHKAAYVRARHLQGMMFWSCEGDPQHVLVDAIQTGLKSKN